MRVGGLGLGLYIGSVPLEVLNFTLVLLRSRAPITFYASGHAGFLRWVQPAK